MDFKMAFVTGRLLMDVFDFPLTESLRVMLRVLGLSACSFFHKSGDKKG